MIFYFSTFFTVLLADINTKEGVWQLDSKNWNEAFSIQSDILVEFYASWCEHCKKFGPEYQKAAKILSENTPPVKIAQVNVDSSSDLAEKYEIRNLPTLLYFINGVPTEYTGGRTSETLVTWVLKKIKPGLLTFDNEKDLEKKIKSVPVSVVLFSEPDSQVTKFFEFASNTLSGAVFILSTSPESFGKYTEKIPGIVLFRNFGEEIQVFNKEFIQNDLAKFIEIHKRPNIVKFDMDTVELVFKEMKPILFLFSSGLEPYKSDFESLSIEQKGTILFCAEDLSSQQKLSDYLGVVAEEQPISVILDPSVGIKKYKMQDAITKPNLSLFISDWKSQKLRPYLKSQKIPSESHENHVQVLVGDNYNEVVMQNDKDVLVMFYAPWCQHCKKLTPHIETLAAGLKEFKNIIIAKIDATVNEVEGVEIAHYPTLFFYSGTDKKKIEVENRRDFDSLLNFIKENANLKVEENPIIKTFKEEIRKIQENTQEHTDL